MISWLMCYIADIEIALQTTDAKKANASFASATILLYRKKKRASIFAILSMCRNIDAYVTY